MTILEKYIWVVNTIFHAGEKGLSLKELNETLWQERVKVDD